MSEEQEIEGLPVCRRLVFDEEDNEVYYELPKADTPLPLPIQPPKSKFFTLFSPRSTKPLYDPFKTPTIFNNNVSPHIKKSKSYFDEEFN